MKRLTVAVMLLLGVVFSVQGQEQKTKLTTCPAGWTAGPDADWKIFWNDALVEAHQSGKKIFVLSTGSDWCGESIKLRRDVLLSDAFKNHAKKKLVLLFLDCSRESLPEDQKKHNQIVRQSLGMEENVSSAAVFAVDSRRLGVLGNGNGTASDCVDRLEMILSEKGELIKSGHVPEIFIDGYDGAGLEEGDEEKMLDRKSQVELKKLAAAVRAKKLAEAEKEINAVENRRGKLDAEMKAKIGSPALQEAKTNAVKWTYEVIDGGIFLGGRAEKRKWVRTNAVAGEMPGRLVIPEIIDGKPVRGIGERAFSRCDWLESVVIPPGVTNIGCASFESCRALRSVIVPEGVTHIGEWAFSGCRGLRVVTLPSTAKSIGNYSFDGCEGLLSMSVPQGVERIGWEAFRFCRGLKSVTIPSSLTSIGHQAFRGCSGLRAFFVDDANPSYSARNGLLCSKDGQKVIASVIGDVKIPEGTAVVGAEAFSVYDVLSRKTVIKSVSIPDGVTAIGNGAFYDCREIESLTFSPGVMQIGESAFGNCRGLKSVALPKNLTNIGPCAFIGCTALASITIDSSNAYFCSVDGVLYNKTLTELVCWPEGKTELTTIPDSVTNVADCALLKCRAMADDDGLIVVNGILCRYVGNASAVTIPSTVSRIGASAFSGCSGLRSVVIPSSVTHIGRYAFLDCKELKSVTIPGCVESLSEKFCSKVSEVTLADGVTSVKDGLFSGCSEITSVTIPEGVTNIGDCAFEYCHGLSSVKLPKSLTSIGERAFSGCSGLKSVAIPVGVTSIGYGAFEDCTRLSLVVIPACVERMPATFQDTCSRISEVVIADGVTSIADCAFSGCSGLESVVIPPSVTKIGDCAFYGCSRLKSVTIPASVTSIGVGAFEGCAKLKIASDVVRRLDVEQDKIQVCLNLKYAKAEDVKRTLDALGPAKGVLGVKADRARNLLTVLAATTSVLHEIVGLVDRLDVPATGGMSILKYFPRHHSPDSLASAVNAVLGEGVASVTPDTNVVVARIPMRSDLQTECREILDISDLYEGKWVVVLDVRRVPKVKSVREARLKVDWQVFDPASGCRLSANVKGSNSCELFGRLDRDDPSSAFCLKVEPRWMGGGNLLLKWDFCGTEDGDGRFGMSGASVVNREQMKDIGGVMRSESRGFFGLGKSDELDTAYLLRVGVYGMEEW